MEDVLPFSHSRTGKRLVARRGRLVAQRGTCEAARRSCESLFGSGRRYPQEIWIRKSFTIARSGRKSPLASLVTSKGVALQTYLVALFEAQCRYGPGERPSNNRLLVPGARHEQGWLDLVASHVSSAQRPATMRDNRLRQLKRALLHLEREHLVQLSASKERDRFERFRLLDEGGRPTGGEDDLPYRVPGVSGGLVAEALVPLPVDFFRGGWVHVLSPAEIALYLVMNGLAQQYPEVHQDSGIFLTSERRTDFYSLSRDVYESHELLRAYGLIEKLDNPNRRPDGSVYRFKDVGNPLEPLRFRVRDRQALHRNAWGEVVDAMARYRLLREIFWRFAPGDRRT
jgi:hypothetical protein